MKNFRWSLGAAALALCIQAAVPAAHAQTLWNNGLPSTTAPGGSQMSDTRQAQDFSLSTVSNLTGIRFWGLEASAADYTGSIFWQISSNSGGAPGATVIGSGLVTPTRTAQGTSLGFNLYQYDFNISLTNVAASTYWLTLHNGPLTTTTTTDFYWATTDIGPLNTASFRGRESELTTPPAAWTTNDLEHAFQVFGSPVPEPSTWLLAGLGVAALLARYRRRDA